jgi:hypothetical protein
MINPMTSLRTLGLLGAVGVTLALAGCASTGPGCESGALCGHQIDNDKNKNVSQSEWTAAFQKADTNGDGSLSPDELEGGGAHWGGGGGGGRR